MTITQCDICQKKIDEEPIIAGISFWKKVELCHDCGKPVLKFLKANGLLEKEFRKLKEVVDVQQTIKSSVSG